ncbi:hypothetical protein BDB00DRAFT_753869 [Zychaea mexicana]|uniref:uncharacterized protein n=1 Tax=Zychaea mexicana TaxID=64656 RepID=UPI0022FE70CE|nr:uncharacterized protein BDB00DRAFT_753869 [Zychaea mexicana]KAI9498996.1 hypothetical protein BDB00DRAFT_753869 [Zychaea mexicana]
MGKLLLVKSSRKKPTAASGSPASQNKSLNGYFRTQKESSTATTATATTKTVTTGDDARKPLCVSDSTTDGDQHEKLVSQNCINDDANRTDATFSVEANNNRDNVISKALPLILSSSPSSAIVLPLSLPSHQQPQPHQYTSNSHDNDDLLLLEDDDLSSLSSLQSEDDVLGPWSEDITPMCTECEASRDETSGPIETDWLCSHCKDKWVDHTSAWLGRIAEKKRSSKSDTEKKQKKQQQQQRLAAIVSVVPKTVPRQHKKQRRTTATNASATGLKKIKKVKTTTKTVKKKLAPAPPPTKSQTEKYVTTGAFMTRNTAKQLADPENGFHPNPYGFARNQKVEVLNINGHWYRGVLTVMKASKVKVSYMDWQDQEEWINMGSRRIRIYSAAAEVENNDDDDDAEEETETNVDQEKARKNVYGDPLLPQASSGVRADDYVSATLDRDPQQIFNDNEVFLTRRMARELTDEHGFRANSFGYRYNRAVAVTFKAARGHNRKIEYLGYLREMRASQVRIWYPTLRQSDWLVVGSRRLRLLNSEEEAMLKEQAISLPSQPAEDSRPDEHTKHIISIEARLHEKSKFIAAQGEAMPSKDPVPKKLKIQETPAAKATVTEPAQRAEYEEDESSAASTEYVFKTTGAFATRRAMRQLKDEHGFVPNPYGYSYNQPIEILNTRTAKNKRFWERGHLTAMRPGQVKVRYDGWNEIYDEWFMVGSRRIRPVSQSECVTVPATSSDLMAPEMNPELKDLAKKKRRHQVLGPEDYIQLGYLIPTDAPVPPRQSEASDYEQDQTDDANFVQKQQKRRKRQQFTTVTANQKRRKKKQPASTLKVLAQKHEEELQQQQQHKPISLRRGGGGGLTSADDHGFIANVYGYDYMQHVQVLNLDKKWYEARLVRMSKNRVLIHYCGWIDKYDEYIPLGSRRLQVIENAHEVLCAEPEYKERYETLILEAKQRQQQHEEGDDLIQEGQHQQTSAAARRNSRRRTLSEGPFDGSLEEIEYHKEDENGPGFEAIEIDAWKVYCNQCNVVIKQFRYYCTYCETPSEGYDYESFELCLRCFDQNFPFWHDHPRSSFAVQAVINAEIGPMPIKGELVTVWEEDIVEEASKVFTGDASIEIAEQGYKYLKRWQRRKVCAFCNDDDDTSSELGSFIGPFVIATYNKNGVERKRQFWAHDACARYSPEVFCTPEGKWYNVTLALRRGRGMRCYSCKEKGATIGCFDSRCNKSFHLPCAQKPVSYFRNGVIFWCPTHEAYYNKKDTYVNIFKCDGCNRQMEDESWFTCLPCASGYFSSFDLCAECFGKLPEYNHPHDQDDFEETSFAIIKEMEAEKAREAARTKELSAAKRKKSLFPRRRRKRAGDAPVTTCCYCGTEDAEEWRKGYDGGVIMCRPCFEVALLVDNNDGSGNNNSNNSNNSDDPTTFPDDDYDACGDGGDTYVTLIENYTHKPYLTRDALSSTKFTATAGIRLATYEPQPHQLFSLVFDSTYFDIPGRAPRWASHSGTDYHGTWLPQTVRRAILKHTDKDERVLSNFLGRGTDAIECFLLQRRCCGVDINPAAVALSQRNCCFEIPPGLTSAEYRPIVAQADSRHLTGPLFADESFHHVLSHPPYKDCVAYSTHLDGDLSRFTNIEEFKEEYIKVVHESWRVLKMGRRLTLGIGDNREHCFYIPVGYHLLRQYIDNGFELEELIIKRQRYCSAFGLGTYLCVQFDFLVFTHEFIATFRKIPRENVNRMISLKENTVDHVRVTRTMRGVPSSAIARKSVVMGTVWVFKPTEHYRFDRLCMSRMVERFGRDDTNWIQIELNFVSSYERDKNGKSDEEGALLSEYEQQRLKRIEENTRTLIQLGLISELSEESTDIMHYETMMSKPPQVESAPLRLMVIAHLPRLLSHHIGIYRQTLIKLAAEAVEKLAPKGMLIIGTQDVRSPDGKLWPMGMLVMEDIERSVDPSTLKLKEMIIAVPDGYSKNRHREPKPEDQNIHSTTDVVDVVDEHLQIVHATYLVFQRL